MLKILITLLISFSVFFKSETLLKEKVKSSFKNPLWDGADPWMTKHGDEYIYCLSSNNSIIVSRSKFITKKGELKSIWSAPVSGWNRACVWAPEIHFIDGNWYVYYAAGKSGPPFIHQRTGVLRSKTDDVFSDYEDMGMLNTGDNPEDISKNVWAIDMTVLEHQGKLFAIWSSWLEQKNTDATPQHLYIQEMENPYTLKEKRVLLSSPEETEDWIIYHSKKTTEPGWDRDVRAQTFTWNSDGTPNFGNAVSAGKKLNRPSGEVEIEMKKVNLEN